jgi:hypothetical protein
MHDVARVDKAEAGFARERRADGRIVELRLGVLDRRLVAFDLRLELIDGGLLGVELLTRGDFLLGEGAGALQVELRVLEVRLVLRLLRERLIEGCLIRTRIDLDENVALLDHLALFKFDFSDLAVDAAAHRDGVVRFHGAEPVQIDGEIGLLRQGNGDWDGNGPLVAIGHCRRALSEKVTPAEIAAKRDPYQDSDNRPSAAEK